MIFKLKRRLFAESDSTSLFFQCFGDKGMESLYREIQMKTHQISKFIYPTTSIKSLASFSLEEF